MTVAAKRPTAPTSASGLLRALGPWTAMAVVVGTVIGSGVFKKPHEVAEQTPFFGMAALAWILGGVLTLFGSLAIAEVAVLYPRAGGNYVFLREGFGRLAGFLWGWVEFLIIKGASLAALATVFSESVHDVLRNQALQHALGREANSIELTLWQQHLLAVAVLLVLTLVNVVGVRWSGRLQLAITLVKVGSLIGILILPFAVLLLAPRGAGDSLPSVSNLKPVWPGWSALDMGRFGAALVGVLWAYDGWINIAPVAEEVRAPQRNIPIALLGGVGVITFLYLGANFAYSLVLPVETIQGCTHSIVATVFSERLLGPIGAAVASAAIMISVFGALNGMLLAGPRVLYAMGEDHLAPPRLAAVHPRFRTPALAIVIMGSWAALLVLAGAALTVYRLPVPHLGSWAIDLNVPAGKSLFDILTDFDIFGVVFFETLGVASIFVFRRRFPNVARPYRCWGYPWTPALYVLLMVLVAINMFFHQRAETVMGLAFIVVGVGAYYVARWRWSRPGQATALSASPVDCSVDS